VFGPEDAFVNRFAGLANMLPVVPVVAGRTRFQPVYALDVARAAVAAAEAPALHGGRTYELGGPKTYSFEELIAWIQAQTYNSKPRIEVPDAVASRLASWFGWLPGAPITRDQWQMLQRDNVVSEGAPGLDALGVRATPLEAIAPTYLVRYRKHGRYAQGERDNKAY
jgi:NADH dehydrogenase